MRAFCRWYIDGPEVDDGGWEWQAHLDFALTYLKKWQEEVSR